MRGVKKESAELVTTRFTGVFSESPELRNDFYRQLNLPVQPE
jgi:GTP cyclohydrolase I